MKRAWLFQDHKQKQKLGLKAPWSVGWLDPEGRRRSKSIGSKSMAEKFRRKQEGELAAGIYKTESRKSWQDFRRDYEQKEFARVKAGTQMSISIALDHFERVCKPSKLARITTKVIEDYVTQRRQEKGARGGPISPATINKELRHLKSALLYAHDAKDLPEVPKIRMLKEPGKLPTYVTPEHFTAIYEHCDAARNPKDLPYSPGEWWKALVVFCYMTGWRISEPLALRRNDLNLEEGTAITRAADNKGGRDEIVPLHPVVLEHLNTIKSFESVVFPWYRTREQLWVEFRRIQEAAGIHLPCSKADEHNCTPACHVYGFHDLRRAFATVNAQTLSADALQRLMRHKDYSTTQRYINLAEQVNKAVENLHVPEVLKTAKGA